MYVVNDFFESNSIDVEKKEISHSLIRLFLYLYPHL